MSSEGFFALEKKCRDMSSEGCADHPVWYNSPLQIKMAIWQNFFEFCTFFIISKKESDGNVFVELLRPFVSFNNDFVKFGLF